MGIEQLAQASTANARKALQGLPALDCRHGAQQLSFVSAKRLMLIFLNRQRRSQAYDGWAHNRAP